MKPSAPPQPMAVSSAAVLTVANNLVALAAGTVTAVLVARLLGPAGKGVVSLVMLSAGLGVSFGGFGVPTYHGCEAGRGEYSRAALRTNALLCAALGSAIMAVVGVVAWQFGAFSVSPIEALCVAAAVPFGLLTRNLAGIFQGEGRFARYNAVNLTMWLTVMAGTAVLGFSVGGVRSALLALWLGYAVAAGLAWWLSRDGGLARPNYALLRAALGFGVAVWCVGLVGEGNMRFDTYVAAFFTGTEGAGVYSVAVSITHLCFHVPLAIGVTVLPRMATGSVDDAARLAGVGCRISLWSSAVVALVVGVLARPLVHLLFGPAFDAALVPLRWLLPGMVLYSTAHVTTAYFYGQAGRPMLNGLVALISLVSGLTASAVLAPHYGLAGVGAGVSLGRGVAIIVNLWLFTRLSGCRLVDALVPRPGDAAILLAPLRRVWAFRQQVGSA